MCGADLAVCDDEAVHELPERVQACARCQGHGNVSSKQRALNMVRRCREQQGTTPALCQHFGSSGAPDAMICAIWMLGLTYTRNWPKKVNSVSTLPAHRSDVSRSPCSSKHSCRRANSRTVMWHPRRSVTGVCSCYTGNTDRTCAVSAHKKDEVEEEESRGGAAEADHPVGDGHEDGRLGQDVRYLLQRMRERGQGDDLG